MNKTIFFSPVGGSDPMSAYIDRDGPMLHITRVYHPDEIVLYMSQEILKKHRKDNRYCYCLNALAERYEWSIEKKKWIKIIKKKKLSDKVQELDFFYEEFSKIIKSIMKKMDSSDRLLLNVSSGTPAMQSALFVLSILGEYNGLCVQVSTPAKRMNNHYHDEKDYCVEERWELNEDNNEGFENRCRECRHTNLVRLKQTELIKKFVSEFDYNAALKVADMLSVPQEEKWYRYLSAAAARLSLDRKKVKELITNASDQEIFLPVQSGDICRDFEYVLLLDIKLRKKQYADFLRAMTPVVYDLFKLILKRKVRFQLEKYIKQRNGMEIWDREKLNGTKYNNILQMAYGNNFDYGWVKSDHLLSIIKEECSDEITDLSDEIRQIEEKARNIAAHKVVSVTEREVEQWTGLKPRKIMEMIKRIAGMAMNIKANDEKWNSFIAMNEMIKEIVA